MAAYLHKSMLRSLFQLWCTRLQQRTETWQQLHLQICFTNCTPTDWC